MLSDIRFAIRQMLKTPGLTLVVVLSLALGIGANATVLSWIRTIIERPLPGVADQARIAVLVSNEGGGNLSLPDLRDFDALRDVFAGVAGSQLTPASLTLDRGTEWTFGQIATANFFDLLGVKPIVGRTFQPDEDRVPGGNPVLVLGEKLWRRSFDGDPDVVGRVVDLNRHQFTVIGVVPAAFHGTMTGVACEFWAPVSMVSEVASWPAEQNLVYRGARPFHNVVRLRADVSLPQARAAVAALDVRLAVEYPKSNGTVHHDLLDYRDCPYGAQSILGPTLRLLLVVSVGVLLIVAANVANLLLARAATREKELAIRFATGASRLRVLRQLVLESTVLALAGGAVGVLLANWGVKAMHYFLPAMREPLALGTDEGVDPGTLGLTIGVTLVTGFLIGLVPALYSHQPRLYEILKQGGGRASTGGGRQHRVRNALVVVEIALAMVLLVGAGLCVQGLRHARQVDFGFKPDRVLIAGLLLGMNGYDETRGREFYAHLQQRLAELPEVEEAALASWFPLGLPGCKGHGVEVEGYDRPSGENPTYEYATISPRYFAVMDIPIVTGRDFTDADAPGAPDVVIVNEHFARKFWPGQEVLGRRFRTAGRWRTIVGVAKAGKYRMLNESPRAFFYLPYRQYVPDLDLGICVRTRGEPMLAAGSVRRAVSTLDPGVDVWGTITLTGHMQGALFAQRMVSGLLACLGAVALLLAAMGVYAVMAYTVSQRTREFGVRMALGAGVGDVRWQVVRQGLMLALTGVLIGGVLALSGTRLLAEFLYGVSPHDPVTMVAVPVMLTFVAVFACWIPARRATLVDPIVALRAE